MRRALVVLSLLGTLASRQAAAAPGDGARYLAEARAALDSAGYDEARGLLQQALQAGDNGPGELIEIYRLLAQAAASLSDDAAAQGFFANMLALAPDYRLAAGTSPKIAEPFAAARQQLGGRSLLVRFDVDGSGPSIAVLVDSDPMSMVASVRVSWSKDGSRGEATADHGPPYIVPLPGDGPFAARIEVRDRFGNRLKVFGEERPIPVEKRATSGGGSGSGGGRGGGGGKDGGPRRRPLYAHWWIWTGVAVAASGAGTYFALDVMSARDEIEALNRKSVEDPPVSFTEAKAVENRGKRSALLANVSFGIAGAAAVMTIISLVVDDPAPTKPERSTVLAPTLSSEGAGVVYRTTF